MFRLCDLPPDILLQIVACLSIRESVSLSMVSKSLSQLSLEHSFWLAPLLATRLAQPLPCPDLTDLALRTPAQLKDLALTTARLQTNWALKRPRVVGRITAFNCSVYTIILACLPAADPPILVLHSPTTGELLCVDIRNGMRSPPRFVGHVLDVSPPLEEADGTARVVLLVYDPRRGAEILVVLRLSSDPTERIAVVLRCGLAAGYVHSGVFITANMVGVARVMGGVAGSIELQSFARAAPEVQTVIVTDRPVDENTIVGTSATDGTVYIIIPQAPDAVVYACPPRLLAVSAVHGSDPAHSGGTEDATPRAPMDYTLSRSHVARLPRASLEEPVYMRIDHAVSGFGRATVSILRVMCGAQASAVELTFWPRPELPHGVGHGEELNEKESERVERARGRLMQPGAALSIPGALRHHADEGEGGLGLLAVGSSGLCVLLVVDPSPFPVAAITNGQSEDASPRPKLILARYDPVSNSGSLHELCISLNTDPSGDSGSKEVEAEEEATLLDTRDICALALDDHRGVVFVMNVRGTETVVHAVPYT
ncbi:hypothetical protein DFH06DRAFT_1200524 [Mycena polygramma]|nr:hypothetical protein DFH06DRAFT_1200524 [Mycena polygramma]